MLSRRTFLSRTGLAAATATALGAPHIARSAEQLAAKPGQKPKRIIHLVSDGMSEGTLTCADRFSQITRKRPLAWMQLMAAPGAYRAMMNTRSLNSMVTDSAAASSAWGSGSRVVNGALNILPDGRQLTPLYTLFAQKGWARGLVSTAEITHATPAGFASSIKSRSNGAAIAAQYLDGKLEVLLGGARPHFDAAKRKDKRDLRGDFAKAGYTVVKDLPELEKAPLDTRLLGLFADGHLPYTVDHLADAKLKASVPTLARLTTVALARLERHQQFILQVEGARIDHAAHNSDAAAAIRDQIAFDEAIEVCLEFQKRHPDTLIVITTDHANSNLGLNGMGGGYRHSSQRFAALAGIKMSYPEILKRLQKVGEKVKVPAPPSDAEDKLDIPDPMAKVIEPPAPGEKVEDDDTTRFTGAVKLSDALRIEPKAIIDIIADATGYRMSARRAELFARVLAGEYQALYDQMNSPITQLGQLMANHIGIGWTGNTHTTDYVPVTACGPGAELFTGFMENTDIFTHYTRLAGIDFKNPSAPLIADIDAEADHTENIAAYALAGEESYA
jgi:alkaline phosphatase